MTTLTLLPHASAEARGSVSPRGAHDFPLSGVLNEVLPLEFAEVSGTSAEALWDQMMKEHHYLGFDVLVGPRKTICWGYASQGDNPIGIFEDKDRVYGQMELHF